MADTSAQHGGHAHGVPAIPVEGDGISYSGLLWFGVILTITTLICMAIVWGMFWWFERREVAREPVRAPLASPVAQPRITGGRVDGGPTAPQPALLITEPTVLHQFREHEKEILEKYGWVDRNAGTIRIPIDRAKQLLLERGLPVRSATTPAPAAAGKSGKN